MSRHLPPGHDARVLSYAGHLARLRAKLAADLLSRPENADQDEQARLWGDRDRRTA